MTALIDITGMTFGRWTVIERRPGPGVVKWRCVCVCGKESAVAGTTLRFGGSLSCGCIRKDMELNVTHGHKRVHRTSPTYLTWQAMMGRCTRPNHIGYARYGARGIKVCERWQTFANFLADMGERPAGLTIDRINGDGDYEPGNCRWATSIEQSHNQAKVYRPEKVRAILALLSQDVPKLRIANTLGVARSVVRDISRGLHWTQREGLI